MTGEERVIERLTTAIEKLAYNDEKTLDILSRFIDRTQTMLEDQRESNRFLELKLVEATDKLNALIDIVDGLMRRNP